MVHNIYDLKFIIALISISDIFSTTDTKLQNLSWRDISKALNMEIEMDLSSRISIRESNRCVKNGKKRNYHIIN